MLYTDVKPWLYVDENSGQLIGVIYDRVNSVARSAGISVEWSGPLSRPQILEELLRGNAVCTPNVIKTKERESLYSFTEYLMTVDKIVVVTRSDVNLSKYKKVSDLLADGSLIFGSTVGVNYPEPLDGMIKESGSAVRYIRGNTIDKYKMLVDGKIDYSFGSEFDIKNISNEQKFAVNLDRIKFVRFPDLPNWESGRIMCSKNIDRKIIDRLNRVLKSDLWPEVR